MRTQDTVKYGKIVDFINSYFLDNGQPPNIREVAAETSMTSTSATRYLRRMAKEGIIEYEDGKQRGASTEITRSVRWGARCIPIVGSIACGTPALAEENIEGYISISTEFMGQGKHYYLRASGDSMVEAGIDDGDLVLVRYQEDANDGQIAVVLTDDGGNTLKRFYRDNKRHLIRLHPENNEMDDIYVKDCKIQGVAIKVIKELE